MKVKNMTNARGNKVPYQFIITGIDSDDCDFEAFQSYDAIIAITRTIGGEYETTLDEKYWDYSVTISKYRNQFLGETKKETQAKIDSGEYILTNLN